MKLKLLIFICVQSVLSDSVPKNGKYAFAYTWSWATIPTGDKLTNSNANQGQLQTPTNHNYDLNIVDPHNEIIPQQNQIIERPTDNNLNNANTAVYYDNRHNPNAYLRPGSSNQNYQLVNNPNEGALQRHIYPSQDIRPTYQNQQQTSGGLYFIPEDRRSSSSNGGTDKTIWYPIVQPNIGNTLSNQDDQRILSANEGNQGKIWYPIERANSGNTVISPGDQKTIWYPVQKTKTANDNIVILPNQMEEQRTPSGNAGGTTYYRVLQPSNANGHIMLPNQIEDQKIPSSIEGATYYRVLQPNNVHVPVPVPNHIQGQIIPSGNEGTIWYPVAQPNRNTLNTPIQTGINGLVPNQGYPNQVTGSQPSNTPAIAFAASNVITPSNLQSFLQNPFIHINSVAYTQV